MEISSPVHGCAEFIAKWSNPTKLARVAKLAKRVKSFGVIKAKYNTRSVVEEAVSALCALGHKKREAERLVSQVNGSTVQEIITNVYSR